VTFATYHGRAPAVVLLAGFGSFGHCRTVVPEQVRAINDAKRNLSRDIHVELRHEIRELYRLRERGVITGDECIAAVQRSLALFK
jgi:hypothetical protein